MSITNNYPPLANKSGMNGDPLDCPPGDLSVKELIEACVTLLAADPEGPIKDAILGCIEAEGAEGGSINELILSLLDGNTTFEIIAGPLPASGTPPTVVGDNTGDTHKQYYADGIRCWSWDGSAWVLDGDMPLPAGCCPAPSIGNVPPAPDAAPPTTNPDGTVNNPVVTGDPVTCAVTHISFWVDGKWWTCECGGSAEFTVEDLCPYHDPRNWLVQSVGNDGKITRVPEHTSICAVARGPFNSGFVSVNADYPTGITELAGSYQDVLVVNNPSDCRDIPLMVDSSARLKYAVPRYNEIDPATGVPEPSNESFTGFIAHQISINGGATWATVTSEQVNLGSDGGEESHIDTTHQENQCYNLIAAGSMTFSTRAVYSSAGTLVDIDDPRMRYMRARVQVYGSTE